MNKPIVAWRILCAGPKGSTTDKHGFAPMRVDHADGRVEEIDLKLVDNACGSFQDRTNLVRISLYLNRDLDRWYIVGQL